MSVEELQTWMLSTADRIKHADFTERVSWESELYPSGKTYVLFIRVTSNPDDTTESEGDINMDMIALRVQAVKCWTSIKATRTITTEIRKTHNFWKRKSTTHHCEHEVVDREATAQEMQMVSEILSRHLHETAEYRAITS